MVDVDLEKFFDRVNHDVLMGRLEKRISDKTVLGLIRRYLDAGIMAGGVVVERHEGTPQGGPLSPLLANVLLDEVDKELEKRGHAFVRYADDCNVYVRSRRAGERVLKLLRRLYARLQLQINESKSAVARVWVRQFLGFAFWAAPKGETRMRVAPKALVTMKDRVRRITRRNHRRSLQQICDELKMYLTGWKAYFCLARTPAIFADLDRWIRRRLRMFQTKQWRYARTVFRELRARGLSVTHARRGTGNRRHWWRNACGTVQMAFRNSFFDGLGVPRLTT